MRIRLSNNNRNHSEDDIENRIKCAKNYENQFRQKIDSNDILKIYTDLCDIEDTYNTVKKLKIK